MQVGDYVQFFQLGDAVGPPCLPEALPTLHHPCSCPWLPTTDHVSRSLLGLVYVLVDDRRLGPRLELARLRTAPGRGARDVLGGAGGAGRPNPAERLFDALDAVLKENRVGGQESPMLHDGHPVVRSGL